MTLAILAGGEGRRMGRPKGELRVGGKPILTHLLDRFQWAGPTLLVTAPGRERPAGAERFTREVTDPTGGDGPLRGVLTALDAAETDVLVVTTCDMPLIGTDHLSELVNALSRPPTRRLVMWKRGGRLEPFPLAIRRAERNAVADSFARGTRSVQSLAALEGAVAIAPPDDWPGDAWTNLNTPEDLDRFLARPGVG